MCHVAHAIMTAGCQSDGGAQVMPLPEVQRMDASAGLQKLQETSNGMADESKTGANRTMPASLTASPFLAASDPPPFRFVLARPRTASAFSVHPQSIMINHVDSVQWQC